MANVPIQRAEMTMAPSRTSDEHLRLKHGQP
jgi:hypothetical protein